MASLKETGQETRGTTKMHVDRSLSFPLAQGAVLFGTIRRGETHSKGAQLSDKQEADYNGGPSFADRAEF